MYAIRSYYGAVPCSPGWRCSGVPSRSSRSVITSYSIHYTKLYDYIIIVNADKVHVTGNKATDKMYHHHTGYRGNLKCASFEKMQAKAPGRVIELAVKGMLPKNPLGRAMYRKLKVYSGPDHRHVAQQLV